MRGRLLFTALAYFVADGLCALAGLTFQSYLDLDWNRNWLGKVLAVVLALAFVRLHPQLNCVLTGLTSKVRSSGLVSVVGLLTISFQAVYFLLVNGEANLYLEDLAYQLTMPGIAEELGYRGVLLSLLNLSLGRPFRLLGAKIGWGLVIQAALFAVPHCLSPDLQFRWGGLFTFPMAIAFGWMTERSGSLLPAIVTHNLGNALLRFL